MFNYVRSFVIHSFKNPLILGSFLMLLGTTIGNFFQFLFNLFMSRNLSVVDYGILASLMSFIMLPSLFSSAIFPTVVSFAATYFANNQISHVKHLFVKIAKVSYAVGLIVFFVILLFASQIGEFFKISNSMLIILAGLNVFMGFTMIINYALLQAKLEFRYMSFLNFFSSLLKLIFGAGLVVFGYSVAGAMVGMFMAACVTYFLSFIPLRHIFRSVHTKDAVGYRQLLSFGGPAALIFFSLTSFVALDIILVKHFLSPFEAGLYAGLSLIGRVIFFLTAPINSVILPLVTQQYVKKQTYQKTVFLAVSMVSGVSLFLLMFYSIWPEFVVTFFLKNADYLLVVPYLFVFSLFITMYSIVFLLCNIFLAIKKTEIYLPMTAGAVSQIILIWFFHNSFMQIIMISLSIMAILLVLLLVYYWHISHENGKKKKK